ncbi:MAG: membrane protease YdiL (CAAX protease family) [Halobacteriales archaeon]|jgi:membrane protease YdiL (CAAX protease family)
MDHRRFLDRHPLAVYTGLTYAISWTFWGRWAAVPDAGDLPSTALYVAGGFGPVLAALLLIRASGRPVRPWLRRTFRVRARPRYYLIALALPVAAVALAGAAHAGVLGGTVTPEAVESPLAYPIFLGVVLLFFGGQEEPGWRGYLLPRLQESSSSWRWRSSGGTAPANWRPSTNNPPQPPVETGALEAPVVRRERYSFTHSIASSRSSGTRPFR